MKKSSLKISHLVFGFALLMIASEAAHAQKPDPVTGKNAPPRTTGSAVKPDEPPARPGVTGVPGTTNTKDTPTPTPTATPSQVNGTTDVPNVGSTGPVGKKDDPLKPNSQVGGVTDQPKQPGKRVDRVTPTPTLTPTPTPVANVANDEKVPVKAVGNGTTDPTQTAQEDQVEGDKQSVGVTDVQVGSSNAPVGTADVVSKTPCEDDAIKKIYEILQKDGSGVVNTLYELTSRRLAIRALDHQSDSLEAMARKDVKDLEQAIAAMKNSAEVKADLRAVYEMYGKGTDLTKIDQDVASDLDAGVRKAKVACYWTNYKNKKRMWNEEASSYVLALAVAEEKSELTDIDVATIWAMEKIRKTAAITDPDYEFGGEKGNLMNISTRVARYLGKIGSARNAGKAELQKEIADGQHALDEAFKKAYEQVKTSLHACIDTQFSTGDYANKACTDCAAGAKEKFEKNRLSFTKIQRGLLQAVSKAENVKMEAALKAKVGNVTFDLSDFAQGTVPEDLRKHVSKVDACGERIGAAQSAAAKRKPASQPVKKK